MVILPILVFSLDLLKRNLCFNIQVYKKQLYVLRQDIMISKIIMKRTDHLIHIITVYSLVFVLFYKFICNRMYYLYFWLHSDFFLNPKIIDSE